MTGIGGAGGGWTIVIVLVHVSIAVPICVAMTAADAPAIPAARDGRRAGCRVPGIVTADTPGGNPPTPSVVQKAMSPFSIPAVNAFGVPTVFTAAIVAASALDACSTSRGFGGPGAVAV